VARRAWVTWLVVHLWFLMGFQNRLFVMLEWALSFIRHGREARLNVDGRAREREIEEILRRHGAQTAHRAVF